MQRKGFRQQVWHKLIGRAASDWGYARAGRKQRSGAAGSRFVMAVIYGNDRNRGRKWRKGSCITSCNCLFVIEGRVDKRGGENRFNRLTLQKNEVYNIKAAAV